MIERLTYNIHSHTSRCGHAIGTDEEYVLAAIKAGYKEMGFSDHVFLPGVSQPQIRADYSRLDEYISSVRGLQEKHKDQIKIFLGFEAEWLKEEFLPYYRELLEKKGFDYLLLGQHGYHDNGSIRWYGRTLGGEEGPIRYAQDLITGIKSGLYTYVCHPDMFVYWIGAWNELAISVSEDIAKASKEYGVPLELNCGCLRLYPDVVKDKLGLSYPCYRFWQIVAKHGCQVTIGIDAHDPIEYETTDIDFIYSLVEELGLNLVRENPIKLKRK